MTGVQTCALPICFPVTIGVVGDGDGLGGGGGVEADGDEAGLGGGIPRVAVKCVDMWRNTNGEGSPLG